jgi:hypothetical protein
MVSLVAPSNAACGLGEERYRTFFTYCWASVDPPWTVLFWRLLMTARSVPLKSIAPCW